MCNTHSLTLQPWGFSSPIKKKTLGSSRWCTFHVSRYQWKWRRSFTLLDRSNWLPLFFSFFFALQPVSSPCRWCRTHRSSRRCRRGWTAWTGRRQGTLRGERVLLIVLRIITFWEVVNIRWVFHGRHGPTKPEVEPVGVLMQAFERRHFIIGKHRRRPELLLLLLGLWLSLPKTFATVSHCEWTSDHQ